MTQQPLKGRMQRNGKAYGTYYDVQDNFKGMEICDWINYRI